MVLALLFSGYPFGAPGHLEKFLLGVLDIAIISYAASYSLGVPLVASLLALGRLTFLSCISMGGILGALAAMAYCIYRGGFFEIWSMAFIGGAVAIVVSSVFCTLAGAPFRKATKARIGTG
jgi:hypothetical protein